MIDILKDYHLAEGINSVKSFTDILSVRKNDTITLLDSVIIHHGFTKSRFDSTLKIYIKDLDYYSLIYEKVIDEINKLDMQVKNKSSK